jgi:hypothetical protein
MKVYLQNPYILTVHNARRLGVASSVGSSERNSRNSGCVVKLGNRLMRRQATQR